MTPVVESFVENYPATAVKDPRWLQVEVCREFQRGKCTRSDAECRFAHPDETIQIENGGKVTACFDSMKVNNWVVLLLFQNNGKILLYSGIHELLIGYFLSWSTLFGKLISEKGHLLYERIKLLKTQVIV